MQDGALFYNRIEKGILGNRIKETFRIYSSLWKKGIFFSDIIWYGRFMEESNYVDELWMTNPVEYIGPKTKKPVNLINYFPGEDSANRVSRYFLQTDFPADLDKYMIYLSPIIKSKAHVDIEISQIKELMNCLNLERAILKLHPNTPDFHYEKLREEFGEVVIRNYVPAEVYIARAINSFVIGCASTSLFYNNPSNTYIGLKEYYQQLGIYADWKNINLPSHVKKMNTIRDIGPTRNPLKNVANL
jgi:hypothetical protein